MEAGFAFGSPKQRLEVKDMKPGVSPTPWVFPEKTGHSGGARVQSSRPLLRRA